MRIGGLLEGPGPPRGESHLLPSTQAPPPPSRPHPSSLHPPTHTPGQQETFHQLLGVGPGCPLLTARSPHHSPCSPGPHREGRWTWPLGAEAGTGAEAWWSPRPALPSCPGVLYSEQSKISALEGQCSNDMSSGNRTKTAQGTERVGLRKVT